MKEKSAAVVKRFLTYSLEREQKICVMLMQEGQMKKTNLRVTKIDEDAQGFSALLPGRKKETHFALSDVLTAAYARGDRGELE